MMKLLEQKGKIATLLGSIVLILTIIVGIIEYIQTSFLVFDPINITTAIILIILPSEVSVKSAKFELTIKD